MKDYLDQAQDNLDKVDFLIAYVITPMLAVEALLCVAILFKLFTS